MRQVLRQFVANPKPDDLSLMTRAKPALESRAGSQSVIARWTRLIAPHISQDLAFSWVRKLQAIHKQNFLASFCKNSIYTQLGCLPYTGS